MKSIKYYITILGVAVIALSLTGCTDEKAKAKAEKEEAWQKIKAKRAARKKAILEKIQREREMQKKRYEESKLEREKMPKSELNNW